MWITWLYGSVQFEPVFWAVPAMLGEVIRFTFFAGHSGLKIPFSLSWFVIFFSVTQEGKA